MITNSETHAINNSVNANIGINNIIEKDEIHDTMMSTFIELANKLKAHCGPYSGTAILTDPDNLYAEPIFTKDGINIISSITYAAPMQDFVRRQLAYMGQRIEKSSGDGTTSSMIIMAYTLASLLEYLKHVKFAYSTNDLTVAWNILIDKFTSAYAEYIDKSLAITDVDTVKFIAASQAYTSSHGDKELARCIGELFSNTPKVVWDTLSVHKAMYECEEKYQVSITDANYTLDDVRLFPNDKCNEELGTVLNLTNVNTYVTDYINIGDENQKDTIKFIEDTITSEQHDKLIVICSDRMDRATLDHFQELFNNNQKHNVIFVLVPDADAYLNDINALLALVYERKNKENKVDDTRYIFPADVYFSGSTFRIKNGLFLENTSSGINPYYDKKEYPMYNEFVHAVRVIINREKADVSRSNNNIVKKFIRILHKLVATKDVVFTVGGAAYDNAAAQDVAIDALLATKCSLTKGFVSGRCVTMKSVLTKLLSEELDPSISQKISQLYYAYINALLSGIDEVNDALANSIKCADVINKSIIYKDAPVDFTRLDDPSYEMPYSLEDAITRRTDYCILQPAKTDITFIKRFGEIGLKFLTANRVITSGYLYTTTKHKGQ